MNNDDVDILIAGAGIAGLAAAARLGADGHRIAVVDPMPLAPPAPVPSAAIVGSVPATDLRTTAYLHPAVSTLKRANAWAGMEPSGAELRVMRIVDAGGVQRQVRDIADFDGAETRHGSFGWNVPNAAARIALLGTLRSLSCVELIGGAEVAGIVPRLDRSVVRLSDGRHLTARLVVAADGRDSAVRDLAGIGRRRWSYGQQALVFVVGHEHPHDGVSTEFHRTGGPLTFVPLPDGPSGQARSSIVWMVPGTRASALAALDDNGLAAALTAESMGLFGPVSIEGRRAVWPIISQIADRFSGERLALIAEAAHVMPPIGAQGLNTSLHDVETLATLLAEHAADLGDPQLLRRYERRVMPRTLSRVAGVDVLNRAAMLQSQPLRDLRRLGLNMIHRIGPLRQFAIRTGMGG
ncbi:MAG: FAD-dependent monooxygenase [Pseudomonadota bacterium]